MKNLWLIIFIVLLFPIFSFAEENEIKRATDLVMEGNYKEGLSVYEQAFHSTTNNPYSYFNAAYAASKIDDPAKAVYYYRKALRLKPDFDEARVNLMLIQPEINNSTQDQTQQLLTLAFIRSTPISWMLLAQFSVVYLLWLLFFKTINPENRSRIILRLMVGIFSVCLFSGLYFYHQKLRTENINAVVIANDVIVRTGPGENYFESQTIKPGTTVTFTGRPIDGWVKVRFANNTAGYLPIEVLRAL